MSDVEVPGEHEKSVDELRDELAEVETEIEQVRQEVDAEHPRRPTFAEGEPADAEE